MNPLLVQQGLAAAVAGVTITGDAGSVVLTSAPMLPEGEFDTPLAAPTDYEMGYHQTFGGLTETLFTVGIFTSRGDSAAGRDNLAQFLAESGSTSVVAAIEADLTLGGAAKTLIVERVRGAGRLYTIAGIDYLGAMLDVRVWA